MNANGIEFKCFEFLLESNKNYFPDLEIKNVSEKVTANVYRIGTSYYC